LQASVNMLTAAPFYYLINVLCRKFSKLSM
jgi:hypothetical protein